MYQSSEAGSMSPQRLYNIALSFKSSWQKQIMIRYEERPAGNYAKYNSS